MTFMWHLLYVLNLTSHSVARNSMYHNLVLVLFSPVFSCPSPILFLLFTVIMLFILHLSRHYILFYSPGRLLLLIFPLLLLRCWKASLSVCRLTSASTLTGRCCRTVRLLKAPQRDASGRWPWSSRPPMHPQVTRWSTPAMSSPPSTSYPGDP